MSNTKEIENWEEGFEKYWQSLVRNAQDYERIKSFIRTELKATAERGKEIGAIRQWDSDNRFFETQFKESARQEERKAWMNGERCQNCGDPKEKNLTELCPKCLEES